MDKEEFEQIKNVCDNYGYATVMMIASALWRDDFNKNNFSSDGILYPVLIDHVKDTYKPMSYVNMLRYDAIVDEYRK